MGRCIAANTPLIVLLDQRNIESLRALLTLTQGELDLLAILQ